MTHQDRIARREASLSLRTPVPAAQPRLAARRDPEVSSRRIVRAGSALIGALVLGFGGWAAVVPLASGVVATGSVMAEGERSTVRHLDGGVVDRVLVEEGDSVVAGQVLVRLDEVQARARLRALQTEHDGVRARLARLSAERADAAAMDVPPDLLARLDDDPRLRDIVLGERRLFDDRRMAHRTGLDVIAQRQGLFKSHIDGLRTQIEAGETQLALLADEIGGLERLFAQGHVPKARLLQLKRDAARLRGQVGEQTSTIAQAEVKITETAAELLQREADYRKDVMAELRQMQARQVELEEEITAASEILRRLDILAHRDGSVLDLRVHARGAVLLPGDPVLDLIPGGKDLQIEARIQPTDIDNVAVGATAEIRFPAFRQRTTPSVLAVVSTLGADTLADQETGARYYPVRLKVAAAEFTRLEGKALVPGMPADVTILGSERTLIEYLVEPITDVLARSFKE